MHDVEVVRSAQNSIQKLQQQRADKVKDIECYKVLHSKMTVVSSQIVMGNMLRQAAEELGEIDRKILVLKEGLSLMPKLCSFCQGRGTMAPGSVDACDMCGGTGVPSEGIRKRADALMS